MLWSCHLDFFVVYENKSFKLKFIFAGYFKCILPILKVFYYLHGQQFPDLEKSNIKSEMRSFKSNENIHKKEGGSYYVVSANKASSVTL